MPQSSSSMCRDGVVSGNYERDAVVTNIEHIVEKARREQIPVIWIQDSGGRVREGAIPGRSSPN